MKFICKFLSFWLSYVFSLSKLSGLPSSGHAWFLWSILRLGRRYVLLLLLFNCQHYFRTERKCLGGYLIHIEFIWKFLATIELQLYFYIYLSIHPSFVFLLHLSISIVVCKSVTLLWFTCLLLKILSRWWCGSQLAESGHSRTRESLHALFFKVSYK